MLCFFCYSPPSTHMLTAADTVESILSSACVEECLCVRIMTQDSSLKSPLRAFRIVWWPLQCVSQVSLLVCVFCMSMYRCFFLFGCQRQCLSPHASVRMQRVRCLSGFMSEWKPTGSDFSRGHLCCSSDLGGQHTHTYTHTHSTK